MLYTVEHRCSDSSTITVDRPVKETSSRSVQFELSRNEYFAESNNEYTESDLATLFYSLTELNEFQKDVDADALRLEKGNLAHSASWQRLFRRVYKLCSDAKSDQRLPESYAQKLLEVYSEASPFLIGLERFVWTFMRQDAALQRQAILQCMQRNGCGTANTSNMADDAIRTSCESITRVSRLMAYEIAVALQDMDDSVLEDQNEDSDSESDLDSESEDESLLDDDEASVWSNSDSEEDED